MNGTIPYTISSGFSSDDRARIAKAIKYLEKETCLRYYEMYRKAQIIAPCLITQPSYSHKINPAQKGHLLS